MTRFYIIPIVVYINYLGQFLVVVDICSPVGSSILESSHGLGRMPFDVHQMIEFVRFQHS